MSKWASRLISLERRTRPPQALRPDPWTLAAEAIWAELSDHAAQRAWLDLVRAQRDALRAAQETGDPPVEVSALTARIQTKLMELTGGDPRRLAALCHCTVADLVREGYGDA